MELAAAVWGLGSLRRVGVGQDPLAVTSILEGLGQASRIPSGRNTGFTPSPGDGGLTVSPGF